MSDTNPISIESGQRIRIAIADYRKAQYAEKMREPDPWEDYEPEPVERALEMT
jgi:hypothetical protein